MVDVFSKEKRSEVMSKIRSTDTKPEMRIRKGLHVLGFRYRLHDKRLPGRPDIVLPRFKTVIQVRGCFWHGHNCIDGHIPKSRKKYWEPKLIKNIERDRKNDKLLKEMGWDVIVAWECKSASNKGLTKELNRINKILNKKISKF